MLAECTQSITYFHNPCFTHSLRIWKLLQDCRIYCISSIYCQNTVLAITVNPRFLFFFSFFFPKLWPVKLKVFCFRVAFSLYVRLLFTLQPGLILHYLRLEHIFANTVLPNYLFFDLCSSFFSDLVPQWISY